MYQNNVNALPGPSPPEKKPHCWMKKLINETTTYVVHLLFFPKSDDIQ